MNRNDFRNPLIQSGIVILVVFLLISIVANSGSQGMIGSIGALVSGLFSGILFIIALAIGILFSIAILIGLYIAAVSFQSVDRGREVFYQVMDSIKSYYAKFAGVVSATRTAKAEKKAVFAAKDSKPFSAQVPSDEMTALSKKLQILKASILEMQASQTTTAERLGSIEETVEAGQDDKLAETIARFNETQQSLSTGLEELTSKLLVETARISDLENSYTNTCEKLEAEIQKLHQRTSVPEMVSGILSYIDLPEDRDTVTEKAEEAISRGMTYNQIDEFFKSSLDPKIYKTLASHPRLTKDFLRSIKKKFA